MTPKTTIPEFAFERGWHTLGAHQMRDVLRNLLDAQPKARFDGLELGKSYYSGREAFKVVNITPSGKQKDIQHYSNGGDGRQERRYFGNTLEELTELSEDLIALLGITHEAIIAEAVRRALPIPAEVRREYPGYFIQVPQRFGVLESRMTGETRLQEVLRRQFPVLTPAVLQQMIDRENRHVAEYIAIRSHFTHENHRYMRDISGYIEEAQKSVDFLRWLQPHIEPGGIFYLPGSEHEVAEPDTTFPAPSKRAPILAV